MNRPSNCPTTARLFWACLLLTAVSASSGCSMLKLPGLPFGKRSGGEYQNIDGTVPSASMTEEAYHSVRRAREENAIVLQVENDPTGSKVLPLPPAGERTVYVSDLITQTGVLEELKYIDATLYRHSPDSIGGLPMEVRMSAKGETIRPESDYALRPGDRIYVRKAASPALTGLLSAVIGI